MNLNPQPPFPLRNGLLVLLCVIYLLTGLLDHDLWKNEDAIHLGIAWGLAQGGDWIQPQLAGQAWGGAPFYHWIAALIGQALAFVFGFHNAARLATALFGALLLAALGKAAALIRADNQPRIAFDPVAVLLAIGTIGLLVPIHEAQPAIAALAGHALVYWGLALMLRQAKGGLVLGAGLIVAGLAGGRPALILLTPLLLLFVFAPWRSAVSLRGWLLAFVSAAVVLGAFAWVRGDDALPTLRGYFSTPERFSRDHFELLAWFTWPVLPIALWSLWLQRRQFVQPHIVLPLIGCVSSLLFFLIYGEPRSLLALPMLVPLTLLAASGAGRLRRGAANAFDWFGMMTFSIVGGLIWLGGVAMVFGVPAQIQRNFTKLAPGFEAEFSLGAWAFAGLLSCLWLLLLLTARRSPWRAATHWAGGVLLMWGLVASLWMPWIDYGKSYASVDLALHRHLPKEYNCMAGHGVGDAQRAALDYHVGIRLRYGKAAERCDWLLVQGSVGNTPTPGDTWEKVWQGGRPGDRNERYYLFKR